MITVKQPEQNHGSLSFSFDIWKEIWLSSGDFNNAKTLFAEMRQNFRRS